MRRRRREMEQLSMSFLDSICCGFGSIILLLVMSRHDQPHRLEEGKQNLAGVIAAYEQELNDILGETELVQRDRNTTISDVDLAKLKVEDLEKLLARVRSEALKAEGEAAVSTESHDRLAKAQQSLTDEQKRLLANYKPAPDEYKVGGIPVDSEYIVFLIDTSGSMQQFGWDQMLEQVRETLEVYPNVKGIQVLNDEGEYMFKSYRGEWIPDSPTQRKTIIDTLRHWDPFSNSNPREGIIEAIRTYYDPNKKISLYVYSDDFATGTGSINSVVREVDRLNHANDTGGRRVRIHGVAFPTIYTATGELYSSTDYATLMRVLCQRNGGTFVALPVYGRAERRRDRN
ncbi:MAG TPA: VWA domain-containing protein [Gammaproteobacteria bacterium]|nr:VWA domain-containing protein [Gammaproteobacteria bacterium]